MTLLARDWKELDAREPTDVANTLLAAAARGDWESILEAKRASMFDSSVEISLRALRFVSALSVLDSTAVAPEARSAIGTTLQEWLKDVDPRDKNFMLFRAVDPPRYFLNACRALMEAGADPYDPGPEHRQADSCINLVFILRDKDRALELMDLLFGGGPITSPDQLPARFVSAVGQWAEKFNLLEMCAQVSRYDLTDAIVQRIVPGSAGEEVVLELGDKVIDRLWMTPDGEDSARVVAKIPTTKSVDVSKALAFLAAGAKLRNPDMWSKVARKNLKGEDEKVVQLIDWIASDLNRPAFKESAAATSRRAAMPRILEAFFEHGAIKVDEIIVGGKSLLMHAAAQDEPTWVAYLLAKGADPLLQSAGGRGKKKQTASQIAAAKGATECGQMIDAFVAKEAISRVLTQSRQPSAGS